MNDELWVMNGQYRKLIIHNSKLIIQNINLK